VFPKASMLTLALARIISQRAMREHGLTLRKDGRVVKQPAEGKGWKTPKRTPTREPSPAATPEGDAARSVAAHPGTGRDAPCATVPTRTWRSFRDLLAATRGCLPTRPRRDLSASGNTGEDYPPGDGSGGPPLPATAQEAWPGTVPDFPAVELKVDPIV